MSRFFKIRRIADGLFYKPKWGATGFHKHGKVYATAGNANAAWKNTDPSTRRDAGAVELVEFEVVEKTTTPIAANLSSR